MNQSQQFEVRHRWQPRSAGPSQAKVGFRVIRARLDPEADQSHMVQVRTKVTGSQFCTVEDHGQQGQLRPRWGPESPNPGEAQVETTVTRSRVVSGADQNHQVQVWCRWQPNSPGPGEALVGNRVTRYMRS